MGAPGFTQEYKHTYKNLRGPACTHICEVGSGICLPSYKDLHANRVIFPESILIATAFDDRLKIFICDLWWGSKLKQHVTSRSCKFNLPWHSSAMQSARNLPQFSWLVPRCDAFAMKAIKCPEVRQVGRVSNPSSLPRPPNLEYVAPKVNMECKD